MLLGSSFSSAVLLFVMAFSSYEAKVSYIFLAQRFLIRILTFQIPPSGKNFVAHFHARGQGKKKRGCFVCLRCLHSLRFRSAAFGRRRLRSLGNTKRFTYVMHFSYSLFLSQSRDKSYKQDPVDFSNPALRWDPEDVPYFIDPTLSMLR